MTLDEISQEWMLMHSLYEDEKGFWGNDTPQGTVHDQWWHPAWIPFAMMISGDFYCLDLNPAPGGKRGQVIEFIHDYTDRAHLGFSVNDFLGAYEQGLRTGAYVYHAEGDAFVRREE